MPWATNLLHFHLNKLFKMVSNLALFCLATYLATFQKIGRFFPNHLVTLLLIFTDFEGSCLVSCSVGAIFPYNLHLRLYGTAFVRKF